MGVDFNIGNDLAGDKVFPPPKVIANPTMSSVESLSAAFHSPPVFPASAVTRNRACKFGDAVNLLDTFPIDFSMTDTDSSVVLESPAKSVVPENLLPALDLSSSVDRTELIKAQQCDSSLSKCLSASSALKNEKSVSYYCDDGVLMCKWSPVSGSDCDVVRQLVVHSGAKCTIIVFLDILSSQKHMVVSFSIFFGLGKNPMWQNFAIHVTPAR